MQIFPVSPYTIGDFHNICTVFRVKCINWMAAIDANVLLLVGHHFPVWLLFADLFNCYFYIGAKDVFFFILKILLFTPICEWQLRIEWHRMSNVIIPNDSFSKVKIRNSFSNVRWQYQFVQSHHNIVFSLHAADLQATEYIFYFEKVKFLIESQKSVRDIFNVRFTFILFQYIVLRLSKTFIA